MGVLDLFRRPARIVDRTSLAEFIDSQAAFIGQKGVFEYSRARAGPFGNVLFKDKGFLTAVEVSRWQSYPLGLMMVGEMVDGELSAAAAAQAEQVRGEFAKVVLGIFNRYETPAAVDAVEWDTARSEIAGMFDPATPNPIRRVGDIPARYAARYVAIMPIHERLRGQDAEAIHNYLKTNLIHMHHSFGRRADLPRLVAALAARAGA